MKKMILPLALTYFLLSTSLFSQGWIPVGQDVLPDNYYTWALSAIDENTVFAICENDDYSIQKLVRTIDGGATWNVVDLSIKPGYPQDIHAISADTIWIVYREASGTTKLYLSTDAGQTLEEKFSYQGNFVIGPALLFGDKESGYMIDPSLIKGSYTNDGGVSWESQAIFPTYASGETWGMANPTNWMDAKGDTIWWGTSKFIHRSTDNGATWQSFDNDFSDGVETKCISFSQSGLGLAASNTNFDVLSVTHISASTDGGATWAELPIVNLPLEGITDVPGLNDAFVGVGGIFKDFVPGITHQYVSAYTLDGGLNWTVIDSFPLNAVEFVSPDAGWAGKILSHEYEGNPVLYKWSGPLTGNRLFVNDDAAGLNNGTSWADAFTDLQSALAIAEEGNEIWVAEGTYLPGSDPTATFLMDKNISLFGGFAGTETALAERGDPADHPTILSGDVNGDDVADDFAQHRSDNVNNVLKLTDGTSSETIIDGFTIQGGHADGTSDPQKRGGGLYSEGSLVLENCFFTQNYAVVNGGGGFVRSNSTTGGITTLVNNCTFGTNYCGSNGGGLYLVDFGLASDFKVKNCHFDLNEGISNGGGLFVYAYSGSIGTSFLVDSCTFYRNTSPQYNGSGFYGDLDGAECHLMLKNSTFSENNTGLFGAAAIFPTSATGSGKVEISGCLFEKNTSENDAGLSIGCTQNAGFFEFDVRDCDFIDNSATNICGGVDLYGESPSKLTADNCYFKGNSAGQLGGGLVIATNDPDFEAIVTNCIFEENQSPIGSAIGATTETNNNPGITQVANIVFDNCLLTGNTSSGATIGLKQTGTLNLLNCTIANNVGGGIVLADQSTLTLQNTVLSNPGHTEYTAATPDVTVTSNGGNLVLDNSLNANLTAQDKPETEPDFMPGTYEPSSTSPLVNAGVNAGVTATTDLAGEERIQQGIVDIGAYESPFVNAAREVIVGEVELSPNPATDLLNMHLPETIGQSFEVGIYDAQGRLAISYPNLASPTLTVQGLAPGMYSVKVTDGERVYVGKFVKQ